ncbi:hypothetical protein QL285_036766 [Trifolium repens]|nr:hypothetical protein QL285_036766 [Trifolium repens]
MRSVFVHIFCSFPAFFVSLSCCLSSGEGFWFFRGGACSNFGSFSFGSGCFVSLLLAALAAHDAFVETSAALSTIVSSLMKFLMI